MTIRPAGLRARADTIPPPLTVEPVTVSATLSSFLLSSAPFAGDACQHPSCSVGVRVVDERRLVVRRTIDPWTALYPGSGPALIVSSNMSTHTVVGLVPPALLLSLIDFLLERELPLVAGERRFPLKLYEPPRYRLLSGDRGGEQGSDALRAREIPLSGDDTTPPSYLIDWRCVL